MLLPTNAHEDHDDIGQSIKQCIQDVWLSPTANSYLSAKCVHCPLVGSPGTVGHNLLYFYLLGSQGPKNGVRVLDFSLPASRWNRSVLLGLRSALGIHGPKALEFQRIFCFLLEPLSI